MNCEQVRIDVATEAVTGEAQPDKDLRDAHLLRCLPCWLERAELRGVVAVLSVMVPDQSPGPHRFSH
ncbi:hypothetical protein [Streptomyces fumanus]|uniref:Uncharacterized protein n=1 Tax=Streptomyces fumanus TaxID=67302 RepID=A0A919B012_9ACTN|nr:hypothetical protein [Streptomyces fumanus]GHF34353.1 hypothetical protein GCM10018772_70000 [Streptomyces fumanus]